MGRAGKVRWAAVLVLALGAAVTVVAWPPSMPPRPTDALVALLARADQVRVYSVGYDVLPVVEDPLDDAPGVEPLPGADVAPVRPAAEPPPSLEDAWSETLLLDDRDPARVRMLVRALAANAGEFQYACPCVGELLLEFLAGEERLASLSVHHWSHVRWRRDGEEKNDVYLTSDGRGALLAWLGAQGIGAETRGCIVPLSPDAPPFAAWRDWPTVRRTVTDTGGRPLAGARVVVELGYSRIETTTGVDGAFALKLDPASRHYIRITHVRTGAAFQGEIPSGRGAAGEHFVCDVRTGPARFDVSWRGGETGSPHAIVALCPTHGGQTFVARSSSDFIQGSVDGPPVWTLHVIPVGGDAAPLARAVVLVPGELNREWVTLGPSRLAEGRVVSGSGAPLTSARVEAVYSWPPAEGDAGVAPAWNPSGMPSPRVVNDLPNAEWIQEPDRSTLWWREAGSRRWLTLGPREIRVGLETGPDGTFRLSGLPAMGVRVEFWSGGAPALTVDAPADGVIGDIVLPRPTEGR